MSTVAICGDPEVLVIEAGAEYAVGLEPDAETVVVMAGEQGPPGRNGVGAGGISYIQDHEPLGASESETWWNPLTLQLKVYHENRFEPVSPDGGHF
ncbi:MAG: hypothetical protein KUL87_10745 [Pseudomonas sp.]|nr:hypothetical protein [Pseudomonas sp.]